MSSAVPARPPRDQRLDVIRGWLQVSIFVSHTANSFVGAWFIHRPWGLSDSSEMFVFLSGFMLGSVFARKHARDGWTVAARDLMHRTVRLYCTHITVCVLFFSMLAVASVLLVSHGRGDELGRLGWGYLLDRPWPALAHLMIMLYEPNWMDILPVFVWCMLVLPLYAWLEKYVGALALLPSVVTYFATQVGWITSPSLTDEIGMGFDPFAWQLLFLGGAWLGRRALLQGRVLPFDAPWGRAVSVAAVGIVLTALVIKLSWHGALPVSVVAVNADWLADKQELVWPRVLHAGAIAWLVAAYVPRDRAWMHHGMAGALATIGRHSLNVFCVGLFLAYVASTLLYLLPAWFVVLDPLLAALGVSLLYCLARMRDVRLGISARLAPA